MTNYQFMIHFIMLEAVMFASLGDKDAAKLGLGCALGVYLIDWLDRGLTRWYGTRQ